MAEYRAIRAKQSMLETIFTPELAAEITLQPINAFGFDAAIIFAGSVLAYVLHVAFGAAWAWSVPSRRASRRGWATSPSSPCWWTARCVQPSWRTSPAS